MNVNRQELTGSSDVEKASLHTAGSLHMGAPPLKTHPRRRFLLFGASGVALALIILFATLFGLAFTGVLSSDKADSSLNAVSNSSLGVRFPDLQTLLNGNARFQAGHADDAELSTLATKGQHPNVSLRFSCRGRLLTSRSTGYLDRLLRFEGQRERPLRQIGRAHV